MNVRLIGATALAAMLAAVPVRAQEHHEGGHHEGWRHEGRNHDWGRHEGWRPGGDIRRFHEHDEMLWRSGRWLHGRHGGRLGWWWIANGLWYFYPAPVYPYPDPYRPPVIAVPAQPAPPAYWYYCPSLGGYYPYVPRCPVPWQGVAPPG